MAARALKALFALLYLLELSQAVDPSPLLDERCFVACQEPFVSLAVSFAGKGKTVALQKCTNTLFVQSVFLCARVRCSNDEVDAGLKYADNVCEESLYSEETKREVMAMPEAQLSSISQFGFVDNFKAARNVTIIPSQDLFDLSRYSVDVYFDAKLNHLQYSLSLLYFWVCIIGAGIFYRISATIYTASASRRRPFLPTSPPSFWHKIRAHLLLPATLPNICSSLGSLPPRIETLTLIAYFILNIIFCSISYHTFPHNLYWDSETYQIWRYLADRIGYLAYANLVVAWLFAQRNNVLAWLTGWEYATFSRWHRWVARIMVLEALIHAIARTVYNIGWLGGVKTWQVNFTAYTWIAGACAMVAACLMLGTSIRLVRDRAYDIFLAVHIALAIAVLVSLFFHTKKYQSVYEPWLWACVAFWAFDRLCRVGRILLCWFGSGSGTIMATNLHEEANLIRVDIASSYFTGRYMHGGHVFLYSPCKLFFWQSHPFTLVRWKTPSPQPAESDAESPTLPTSLLKEKAFAATTTSSVAEVSAKDTEHRYSLLLQPNKGYTSHLRNDLSLQQSLQSQHFFIEGPYGSSPDLRRYSDVWFFIGGSGISVAITSIYNLLERNADRVAAIRLVWASRSSALVDTVARRELACALGQENVEMDVYLTGNQAQASLNPEKSHSSSSGSGNKARLGRPNVQALMRQAITSRAGSLAFVVCGPNSLTENVRRTFCQELSASEKGAELGLFVQSFTW